VAVHHPDRPPGRRPHRLLAAGLVDELHLILGAAVVGGDTPLFGTRPLGPLRLAEIRRFDGSDNVLLRYEVTGR
jgi:riboflavin biosynthesis pyrimidine reductase